MWIMIQHNEQNTRFKYLATHDYNAIISYINKFSDVKKYSDYLFITRDGIYFEIKLGEDLDYYEKTSKKKKFNKENINRTTNRSFRERNKKIS